MDEDIAMDTGWIAIDDYGMPTRIHRDADQSSTIVDFTETQGGELWDFAELRQRQQARRILREVHPGLVVCDSGHHGGEPRNEMALASGIDHVEFGLQLCEEQRRRGLYYIITVDRKYDKLGDFQVLRHRPDVQEISAKDKVIITNNENIAEIIKEQQHVEADICNANVPPEERSANMNLVDRLAYECTLKAEAATRRMRRTRWAEENEEELNHMELELNKVDEDEVDFVAWDDMKGSELNIAKVREARDVEMQYIRRRNVYRYAKRAHAQRLGKNNIGVKWLDTNKGDEPEENYRS